MPFDPSLELGDRTHLIHIGPHKTGTSAVQTALFVARRELGNQGVYIPKGSRRRRKAGWALGIPGGPAGVPVPERHHWTDLVEEVAAVKDAKVVVSNEDFGRASADQARTLVESLGGDDVHVVAAVRNLDRLLPSLWQERVKAGIPDSYEDWLRVVLGEDPKPFEKRDALGYHDIDGLVSRWADIVGPDRFTFVVIDDNDPGDILRVFESLLGLSKGQLPPPDAGSNRGISYAECEMVRALNQHTEANKVPRPERAKFISRAFIQGLKDSDRPKPGPRGAVHPAWAWDWIRAENDRRASILESSGVRVVGDPEKIRVIRDRQEIGDDYVPHVPIETMGEAVYAMLTTSIAKEQEALARVTDLEDQLRAAHASSLRGRAGALARRLRSRS